jgi:hypothetical protein
MGALPDVVLADDDQATRDALLGQIVAPVMAAQ